MGDYWILSGCGVTPHRRTDAAVLTDAARLLEALLESARQDGYDEGYTDGASVRPAVVDLASRRAPVASGGAA